MAEHLEKETDVSTLICSAGVLADMLGIKQTTVRHLASSGVMPRVTNGRYKLRDCVHNYVMQLRIQSKNPESGSTDEKPELRDMQAKHEAIKLQMSDMQLKLMQGKLHKSEDVEKVMTNMLASMRAKLLSLPSRIAPSIAGVSDPAEVVTILKDVIYDVLHELADYTPEMFYGEDLMLDDDGNLIVTDEAVSESDTEVNGR